MSKAMHSWNEFVERCFTSADVQETEANWGQFETCLSNGIKLLRDTSWESSANIVLDMKRISQFLSNCLLSDRTRLSGIGCEFLQQLASVAGVKGEILIVENVFASLLKVTLRANKVFIKRATQAAVEFVKHCTVPRTLSVLWEFFQSPNKTGRICVAECFYLLIDQWSVDALRMNLNIVCFYLQAALIDAASEVRELARKTFHQFEKRLPSEANGLKDQLPANALKLIGASASANQSGRQKFGSFGEFIRSPEGQARKHFCRSSDQQDMVFGTRTALASLVGSQSANASRNQLGDKGNVPVPSASTKLSFLDSLKTLQELSTKRDKPRIEGIPLSNVKAKDSFANSGVSQTPDMKPSVKGIPPANRQLPERYLTNSSIQQSGNASCKTDKFKQYMVEEIGKITNQNASKPAAERKAFDYSVLKKSTMVDKRPHEPTTALSVNEALRISLQKECDYPGLLKMFQESNDWQKRQSACTKMIPFLDSNTLSDTQKSRLFASLTNLFGDSHFRVVHGALETFFCLLLNPDYHHLLVNEQNLDQLVIRLIFIQINPTFKLKPNLLELARKIINSILSTQLENVFRESNCKATDDECSFFSLSDASTPGHNQINPLQCLFNLLWIPELASNGKARFFLLRAIYDNLEPMLESLSLVEFDGSAQNAGSVSNDNLPIRLRMLLPKLDRLLGETDPLVREVAEKFINLIQPLSPAAVELYRFKNYHKKVYKPIKVCNDNPFICESTEAVGVESNKKESKLNSAEILVSTADHAILKNENAPLLHSENIALDVEESLLEIARVEALIENDSVVEKLEYAVDLPSAEDESRIGMAESHPNQDSQIDSLQHSPAQIDEIKPRAEECNVEAVEIEAKRLENSENHPNSLPDENSITKDGIIKRTNEIQALCPAENPESDVQKKQCLDEQHINKEFASFSPFKPKPLVTNENFMQIDDQIIFRVSNTCNTSQ